MSAGGIVRAAGGGKSDSSIVATADSDSASDEPSSDDELVPEVCSWGSEQRYERSGRYADGPYVFAFVDLLWWRMDPVTGEVWVRTHRTCSRGETVTFEGLDWRRVVEPDPGVLAGSVYDEVVRQVPVPEPALSPVGPGFVNLGMWLAVEESPPISVTARAGSVWATTSAEVVSTSFDMGDGTVVTCDGVGDPIPSSMLDSVEASPKCGHTYTTLNDREPFLVTVTSTWRVSWVGSGGAGGDLGTLDRSSSLDYQVLEIQTVGS